MPEFLIYYVDMDKFEQTKKITAPTYEKAEAKLREKTKVYYMWKIEEIKNNKHIVVFP